MSIRYLYCVMCGKETLHATSEDDDCYWNSLIIFVCRETGVHGLMGHPRTRAELCAHSPACGEPPPPSPPPLGERAARAARRGGRNAVTCLVVLAVVVVVALVGSVFL